MARNASRTSSLSGAGFGRTWGAAGLVTQLVACLLQVVSRLSCNEPVAYNRRIAGMTDTGRGADGQRTRLMGRWDFSVRLGAIRLGGDLLG